MNVRELITLLETYRSDLEVYYCPDFVNDRIYKIHEDSIVMASNDGKSIVLIGDRA